MSTITRHTVNGVRKEYSWFFFQFYFFPFTRHTVYDNIFILKGNN